MTPDENGTEQIPNVTATSDFDEEENKPLAERSEVDIAYKLLSRAGKEHPTYFKDLIREIISIQGKVVQNEAAAISEIYTMINMDSRFQHIGDGLWGLTDWYPPETKRSRSTTTKAPVKAS